MKKQCEKLPSWGCKGLLSVALISLAVVAHAQNADVCYGIPYTIASAVDASGVTAYRWLENGKLISGSAATFLVPANKAVGNYTYIRQAKSEDCDEWQSSNEFAVTIFDCAFSAGTATGATATFTDPRDGERYKTVVMPDGKTWFAQNLNYTKDMTYNAYVGEANGVPIGEYEHGVPAIGSYWCPGVNGSVYSGSAADCRTYGAFYTWETTIMLDGKYADETRKSSVWDHQWVTATRCSAVCPVVNLDHNVGRGEISAKGGGRGICPKGWHVPTVYEWAEMLDLIDGDGSGEAYRLSKIGDAPGTDSGAKLRSSSTCTDWGPGCAWSSLPARENALDVYGFAAIGSGIMRVDGWKYIGREMHLWYNAWSLNCPYCDVNAMYFSIRNGETKARLAWQYPPRALPVRCRQD